MLTTTTVGAVCAPRHQREMAGMQRAHGGHHGDTITAQRLQGRAQVSDGIENGHYRVCITAKQLWPR